MENAPDYNPDNLPITLDLPIDVPPYPRVTVHLSKGRGGRAWTNNPDALQRLTAFYEEFTLRVPAVMKKRPMLGELAVRMWLWKKGRGDVDNIAKSVLDAGTRAGIWGDDSQVKALSAVLVKEGFRVSPRLVMEIAPFEGERWGP